MKSKYTYWLPDGKGKRINYETDTNSIMIIGANGAGKSKLGASMEQQEMASVHRIGAQRNINISEHIKLKSYSDASDMFLYGSMTEHQHANKDVRWEWGKSFTTKLLDDFDDTLAALIALHNNKNQEYVLECRVCEEKGEKKPETRDTPLDEVLGIWNSIFLTRELFYDDGTFKARIKETNAEYSAREMSDGERSVLYLASQVLTVPADDNRIIIMDEPEVHLNRSLLNALWKSLEGAREDCLFVYITHDVDFIMSHPCSTKVWVKDFKGDKWEIDILEEENLPEQLRIKLLGNRKPVLFVEGDYKSYDYAVYSAIYADYQVIPVGSCTEVIQNVRAFRKSKQLHEYRPCGIIDCDYRSKEQLESLKSENIFHLEVAEIENLFLTEPVVRIAAKRFAPERQPDEIFSNIKSYVIQERFIGQIDKRKKEALTARVKETLVSLDVSKISLKNVLDDTVVLLKETGFTNFAKEIEDDYDSAATEGDYDTILKFLNEKSVVNSVGHFFGLNDRSYVDKVVSMFETEDSKELIKVMRKFLPELPPANVL